MSWDATLSYGRLSRNWNYTHNTNSMIEKALGSRIDGTTRPWWVPKSLPPGSKMGSGSWWQLLDGTSGAEGAILLADILYQFDEHPHMYRTLNPENGWGDFDGLRQQLREMRDASKDSPQATWSTSG